jgi:phosphoserine phosphatase RsbU/P
LNVPRQFQYTNGGHNPPLWIQKNGNVTELMEAGLLLGFRHAATYPEGSVQLAPGDLLFLYTDGVTDSVNEKEETFGMNRLLDWADRRAGRSPAEVKESLIDTVGLFCGKSRQADDLTVLVVQYREPSSGLAAKDFQSTTIADCGFSISDLKKL